MQIAGVPERHEPDTGEINYPAVFRLLDRLGYRGLGGLRVPAGARDGARGNIRRTRLAAPLLIRSAVPRSRPLLPLAVDGYDAFPMQGPRGLSLRLRAAQEKPMKVADILRVKGNTLFTVTPDTPLAHAVAMMAEQDIGSVVVMEYGELVGMLTFREVINRDSCEQRRGR